MSSEKTTESHEVAGDFVRRYFRLSNAGAVRELAAIIEVARAAERDLCIARLRRMKVLRLEAGTEHLSVLDQCNLTLEYAADTLEDDEDA